MRLRALALLAACLVASPTLAAGPEGNRLAYLDDPSNPYYVGLDFPKLTTPQWVGEEGVEAVVVLAVDDMTNNIPKYEVFLRPILDRLKAIDGRAPVSIMTNRVDPEDPHLQRWLQEGVNIDVHTLTHPCPLLQKGDFKEAERTYHGCVDLLHQIPNNRPVAFRVPCCDSLNTPSPRFYEEIFNKASPEGHFLTIDSSVFTLTTPNDPALPRELVLEPDGSERFRKYLPFKSFVNTIEDYPYPYIIGRLCWEFPCIVPSDWEAQNLQKPNSPKTVEDLKAALDVVVRKQGVFNLVFHPHNWIKSEQIVELIDHAVTTHGKKVKFLNFREAQERLDKNLLDGHPIRDRSGRDSGVRLLDLNRDGFLDVVIGDDPAGQMRVWNPSIRRWEKGSPPAPFARKIGRGHRDQIARFGSLNADGQTMLLADLDLGHPRASKFDGKEWWGSDDLGQIEGLTVDAGPPGSGRITLPHGYGSLRLRDLDGDGRIELLIAQEAQPTPKSDVNLVFAWSDRDRRWNKLPFALPGEARILDSESRDAGLRFVDLDEDGRDDVVYSNDRGYGIYLFDSMKTGWSRRVMEGKAGDADALPRIVRDGKNNGFWVHSRGLWWQNEDTAKLPDLVDRRSFNDLLKDVEPGGKSPEASRRSIRVRPGFKVEIAAQEPLVEDPIAFEWGADGKLWVVEMGDYPMGADGKGKPGGVIRFLEDTDNDGRYDKSTVFLDGLGLPTGIIPWRNGVIVGCAPDIFFAEDRDGDGKADRRETLFTGFSEGNPQHRLNGFDLGLDGWVYGANGDSGGVVRSLRTGQQVAIQGRDFRFRPDTGEFEAESGQTQYGRHRNDWGDWFGNNNPNLAWHYVLSDHDLRRNPRLAVPDPRQMLDPDNTLYPVSRTVARFNDLDNANRVTSANSPTPYRDDLFGPAFANSLFVSEPVHNLVRRVVVEPDGATFRGHRAADESDREFLASGDNWFRPTMLKTGPDGALWVADMYRAVIEHPEWIPDDWEAKLDLRAGHDRGRIYRVYPVDQTPRPIPRLDRLDTAGLVAALESPSGWRRDTAMRLLMHRADPAAIEPLEALALESPRPKVRVQALATLDVLGGLMPAVLQMALADPHPEVRRQALRAGERLWGRDPLLGDSLERLADDPDPRVRFQLALSLGAWDDPRAGKLLARLLRRDGGDRWARAAALSSAAPQAPAILTALFAEAGPGGPSAEVLGPLFALVAERPDRAGLKDLFATITTPDDTGRFADWQFAAAGALAASVGRSREADSGLKALLDDLGLKPTIVAVADEVADDEAAPDERRVLAIRLLAADSPSDASRERLARLLRPQVAPRVQQAALEALARSRDPKVPDVLLADWKGSTPALRDAILDVLLGRGPWTAALLSSLEDGRVPPAEVGPVQRRRLLEHRDKAVRRRAAALFAGQVGNRKEVVEAYRDALALRGEPNAGAAVFKRVCATCHRLGGEGHEVGPDLAALTDRTPEALLTAILDPNRAFEAKYTSFSVQTTDGRVLTGLIAAETGTGVTLRREEGREETLLRADIEAIAGSGQSLMPEGLEKDLSKQDLADLIAFLASTGPPRKAVAGHYPRRVAPKADGTIVLGAGDAEISGDTLTFENHYGNLGLWSSPNDRASWTFDAPKPGRYAVRISWACDNASQGNTLVLEVDRDTVEFQVPGTGSWDDYRSTQVGEVNLGPGPHRLVARSAGPIRGALIDLRAVELRPAAPSGGEAPGCCGGGD